MKLTIEHSKYFDAKKQFEPDPFNLLLSTLRRYVESMGGKLELVAQFPNRPPVVIDHLGKKPVVKSNRAIKAHRTPAHRAVA